MNAMSEHSNHPHHGRSEGLIGTFPTQGGNYNADGEVSGIDCEEINRASREALMLCERLDQLTNDKQALGL
jgi:hypothetical protein